MSSPPSWLTVSATMAVAEALVAKVAREAHAEATGIGDESHGVVGILDLLREVRDRDVGALTGEGDRDCPPDPRVAAGDEGRRPARRPAPR